jgi:hypothetical protein
MSTPEQRWARSAALFNFALAAGMAVPGVDQKTYRMMDTVDRKLGGPGVKAPEGMTAVMANTAGLTLGLLGALLLWAAKDLPARQMVTRWNAFTRLGFFSVVAARGLTTRLPRLLWGFAASDVLLAAMLLRRRPQLAA